MKVKELKEIIMNLNDDYDVVMEEQNDKVDTVNIQGVEISTYTKEVVFKNY